MRKLFLNLGLMEDWEYTDLELLERLHRLLFTFEADPFNGRRGVDLECQTLVIHAAERINAIMGIAKK